MPRLARQPPRSRRSQRGAAMLMAVVSVAILTALAADLAYETQVRLRIAGNARDELRAAALAQGAVHMGRLVLSFQQQIDRMAGAVCQAQAGAGGGASPACPRPQLWNLVPVSSILTDALFGDEGGGKAGAKGDASESGLSSVRSTGMAAFQGNFDAKIDDEGQKINAQLDAAFTSGVLGPQVEALLRMVCDSKWDGLFDRSDVDGQRYSRSDLVIHLRDWVDDDNGASNLAASFPGGNCSFVVAKNPFEKGFSDENAPYDRGSDRYRAKNARFDSLDELHMIAGVSDAFMAAFADQLTVYLPREAPFNVNSPDPRVQLFIAGLMADPSSIAKLVDPAFQAAFRKAITAVTMGGFLSMTPVQFAQMLEGLGVKVRSQYLTQTSTTGPFTDRSLVYRIRAKGKAGMVEHKIDAVVSYDPNLVPPEERPPPGSAPSNLPPVGRLIHWRED